MQILASRLCLSSLPVVSQPKQGVTTTPPPPPHGDLEKQSSGVDAAYVVVRLQKRHDLGICMIIRACMQNEPSSRAAFA